ncbi:MAG: NAD(P)H-binding protein [Streptosporangiaceae bacterium]
MTESLCCLVTEVSGYIGGRLVPELLAAGHQVRCMARDPGKLADRPWSDQVEVVTADAGDAEPVRDVPGARDRGDRRPDAPHL